MAIDQAEGDVIDPQARLSRGPPPKVGRHGLVVKFKSQVQLQTVRAVVNHRRNHPSPENIAPQGMGHALRTSDFRAIPACLQQAPLRICTWTHKVAIGGHLSRVMYL